MVRCSHRPRRFRALKTAQQRRCALALAMLAWVGCILPGCKSFAPAKLAEASLNPAKLATEPLDASHAAPSNFRDWEPDQAVLPYAEISGDEVKVYNIRHCLYLDEKQYAARYYHQTYDLRKLDSVDLFVVPFRGTPSLAHTMLSFGFQGEEYLAISVEVRKEKGETYSPWLGMLGQYELTYVVGDERDLVGLRVNHRKDDVYLYRAKATPEQARSLFLDVMQRVNKLHEEPEFYHTITNNCTTNIAQHVNRLSPSRIPYDPRLLLSGYSDQLAYELGLLDTKLPFKEARRRAEVSDLVRKNADHVDFSARIRRR
jgi:hypothetical protein